MDASVLLGLLAGAISLLAFALYNKDVLAGRTQPNTVAWALFAFLVILNSSSYLAMSGDWVKSLLPLANAMACILTFLLGLAFGKFKGLTGRNKVALSIGVVAALGWWLFRSATFANLLLQATIIIAFIPLIEGVWRNPSIEKPLPWWLWSIAFTLNIGVVLMRWNGQWQDLGYPINVFVLHTLVAILCSRAQHTKISSVHSV
jgi:hypothetical protein